MSCRIFVKILISVRLIHLTSAEEYCNSESFKPRCQPNEIIQIQESIYGRRNVGRCIKQEGNLIESLLENSGFIGCYTDVGYLIEPLCSGRVECDVLVATVDASTPCHRSFMRYLEVSYKCVKEEFCISESFKPKCSANEIIVVRQALFGRRQIGRCLKSEEPLSENNYMDKKFIGCYADVRSVVDAHCSGKQSCEVSVVKLEVDSLCHRYLIRYLDVEYVCLREEYCNDELFHPSCSQNEIIYITSAYYGRKSMSKCLLDEGDPDEIFLKTPGFINCFADVRHILEPKCAARQSCEVSIALLKVQTTCLKQLKHYLEVHYRCQEGFVLLNFLFRISRDDFETTPSYLCLYIRYNLFS
ncbi:hypothetical protein HELRODRAFT_163106 [Helobdella robusta]|uniref:SUEL-type lectin domain-containing protein n=1 Tax=Helobdella robusta TaxID=6412 RepID=T1ETN6_HELRO|nr:hypothetical protein HELRODRAFT_163106 [Helobdella robusta]ESN96076.1 hypothetical protein HELRODRAFT_163106 [Helobdella robusta]